MEDSDYSLADFNTWKVNALKAYLSKRNLKVEGNKATLVARAFPAWEMKVLLAETNVQLEIEKNQSYRSLLTIGTDGSAVILLDPCKDILSWKIGERRHERLAPVYFSDICVSILSRHAGKYVGMLERILNEYKEGKAFQYFDNNWLKEVFFCDINNLEYCYLKAQCTPSQRVICLTMFGSVSTRPKEILYQHTAHALLGTYDSVLNKLREIT
jgi:hypothetical protein